MDRRSWCTFAHGKDDLFYPEPAELEHALSDADTIVSGENRCLNSYGCLLQLKCQQWHTQDEQNFFRSAQGKKALEGYKQLECRYHLQGNCIYINKKEWCTYAHGAEDVFSCSEIDRKVLQTMDGVPEVPPGFAAGPHGMNKTKMKDTTLHQDQSTDNKEAPREFRCPITECVMKDPAFLADGRSYEYEEAQRWLSTSDRSPITGKVLAHTRVIRHVPLAYRIAAWRAQENRGSQIKRDPPITRIFWTAYRPGDGRSNLHSAKVAVAVCSRRQTNASYQLLSNSSSLKMRKKGGGKLSNERWQS